MELPEEHPVTKAFSEPDGFTPLGGESIMDVMERTNDFLNEKVYPLLEQGTDVLVVGHGLMNSTIILNVMKLPVSKLWDEGIENCVLKKLI
jgi:probable phosphoglycerate mutase